jgi:hypothetical protein
MKTKSAVIFGLTLLPVPCFSQSADWTTVLRQTQVATGVEYIAVVPKAGSQVSFVPLELGGAVFELWGIKGSTDTTGTSGAPAISTTVTSTGHYNNGHGNNVDGVDSSNPGQGGGGPTGLNNDGLDPSAGVDDESKGGTGETTTTTTTTTTSGTTSTTSGSSGVEEHLLDTEFVDAYQPAASVRILTEDPYPHSTRTRADRPFSVEYTVSGLVSETLGVEAASKVLVRHDAKSYSLPIFIDGNYIQTDSSSSVYISQNGMTVASYPSTNLPKADPLRGVGIEVFTVDALPDEESNIPSTRLATATLEVFPVAEGALSGITHNQTYKSLPPFTMTLKDLYPTSNTYVQIYPGPQKLGTEGIVIPDSFVNVADATSQSTVKNINTWQSFVDQHGLWTMELITETPFGVERLAWLNFTADFTVVVNGQVFSSE